MGIKRKLKKQAKKAEQEILEQSRGFYEEFMATNFPDYKVKPKPNPKAKKKKRLIVSLSSAFACVAVCAVMLILFLPNVGVINKTQQKKYQSANQAIAVSTISEVNNVLDGISFNNLQDYEYAVTRAYDAKYNDTLFFEVKVSNWIQSATIYIYNNKNYENRKSVDFGYTLNVNALEFLTCKENTNQSYIYNAQFIFNDITFYIEYSQIKIDNENDNFISFLEQTFTLL